MVAHASDRPADVRELACDVPETFAMLLARCLEKDPAARPAARAMARELAAIARDIAAPMDAASVPDREMVPVPAAASRTTRALPYDDAVDCAR